MSAQAILRAVVDASDTRPRLRVEAEQTLRLLEYLKIDDEAETILFLLGTAAGLQDRIDSLERRG